jgi:hypothetical protein
LQTGGHPHMSHYQVVHLFTRKPLGYETLRLVSS